MAQYNKKGEEILDDTPVEVPVRFQNRPLTTVEEAMRALSLASAIAERDGLETFEDSLDFNIEDDELSGSSEFSDMDERELLEFMRAGEEEIARRKQKKDAEPAGTDRSSTSGSDVQKKPADSATKAG